MKFNFFQRYVDREPFLAASWIRLAWFQYFGEELK